MIPNTWCRNSFDCYFLDGRCQWFNTQRPCACESGQCVFKGAVQKNLSFSLVDKKNIKICKGNSGNTQNHEISGNQPYSTMFLTKTSG